MHTNIKYICANLNTNSYLQYKFNKKYYYCQGKEEKKYKILIKREENIKMEQIHKDMSVENLSVVDIN